MLRLAQRKKPVIMVPSIYWGISYLEMYLKSGCLGYPTVAFSLCAGPRAIVLTGSRC